MKRKKEVDIEHLFPDDVEKNDNSESEDDENNPFMDGRPNR